MAQSDEAAQPLTEIYNLFTPDESYNFFCGVGYAQVKDATL